MVTVGYLQGGQALNVIPDSVKLGGTFRSLTSEGLSYLKERIKEVDMPSLSKDFKRIFNLSRFH